MNSRATFCKTKIIVIVKCIRQNTAHGSIRSRFGLAILSRSLLKRGNFKSIVELMQRILDSIDFSNLTKVKPFWWIYVGTQKFFNIFNRLKILRLFVLISIFFYKRLAFHHILLYNGFCPNCCSMYFLLVLMARNSIRLVH